MSRYDVFDYHRQMPECDRHGSDDDRQVAV
jgi:hypothetical protein